MVEPSFHVDKWSLSPKGKKTEFLTENFFSSMDGLDYSVYWGVYVTTVRIPALLGAEFNCL